MVTCRSHGSVALLAQATNMGLSEAIVVSVFVAGAFLVLISELSLFLLSPRKFGPHSIVVAWSRATTVVGRPVAAGDVLTGGHLGHLAVHASEF